MVDMSTTFPKKGSVNVYNAVVASVTDDVTADVGDSVSASVAVNVSADVGNSVSASVAVNVSAAVGDADGLLDLPPIDATKSSSACSTEFDEVGDSDSNGGAKIGFC